MLRLILCDYSDAYILVSGTITITRAKNDDAARQFDERNNGVIFKNCVPFTDWISEINNTQLDNANYIDVIMSVYNLIENSDNCSKTSTSLWQNYRDDLNDNITPSESFKYKCKRLGKTSTAGTKEDVEIAVPLKYLPLINFEIYLILTWSESCVISNNKITLINLK